MPTASLFRERQLAALTPTQLKLLPHAVRSRSAVVLAVGAIEQHGPHLPVGVDALLGQLWSERLLFALAPRERERVWFAPPLLYGKSIEHAAFPGTLSLSSASLRSLLRSAAGTVDALGFGALVLLNTHGGNSAVLVDTLRDLAAERTPRGCRFGMLSHGTQLPLPTQEQVLGFHAGTVETAWLLAAAPEQVLSEHTVREYPRHAPEALLLPEKAAATYGWLTQDVSSSGVLGDATAATAEQGRAWIEEITQAYATRLTEFLRSELTR